MKNGDTHILSNGQTLVMPEICREYYYNKAINHVSLDKMLLQIGYFVIEIMH